MRPLVRRPRLALPALAAALALGAVVAGPVVARGRQPAWRVQTLTTWPAAQLIPAVTVGPLATPRAAATPRPAGGSFGPPLFTVTTVAAAQPHLSFPVLVPAALPPSYQLARTQSTPYLFRSPRLPPLMGWIELVYYNPAQQPARQDWRLTADGLPAHALTIDETAADRGQPMDIQVPPGAAHQLTLGGVPALYLDTMATQRPGSAAVVPNPAVNQLVLARAGTLITITGWRDGGVDRAALERIAASLR